MKSLRWWSVCAVTVVVGASCGGDDNTKKALPPDAGVSGGSSGTSGSGGSSSGGTSGKGGSAGRDAGSDAGEGGSPEGGGGGSPEGGAGGSPEGGAGGATNQPPVAAAGDDAHVMMGRRVTLNGSGDDPDGDALTFAWTQTSGPTVTLDDPTVAAATLRLPAVGIYEFMLTVSAGGLADTATVTLFAHSVNGGAQHSVAAKPDGTVWAWGDNSSAQLGAGSGVTGRDVPGRVCNVGATDCDADPLSGVIAISSGNSYALALKSDGTVLAWGYNTYGLGTGIFGQAEYTPAIVCAGENAIDGGVADCVATPLSDVVAIAAGYEHAMALKSDGTVWAWGTNVQGQLGMGDQDTSRLVPAPVCAPGATPPCSVGDGNVLTGIKVIAAGGGGHTLALDENGALWAWGHNKSGQVGNGEAVQAVTLPVRVCAPGGTAPCAAFLPNVVEIDAWSGHSLALDANGAMWGWGGNDESELGSLTTTLCGATNCSTSPSRVCTLFEAPCTAPLQNVAGFAAARRYSVAVLADGTVRAWGDNLSGQLGNGTYDLAQSPVQVCGAGTTGPCNVFLGDISAVAAGNFHTFALSRTGTLFGWGEDSLGQVGDGPPPDAGLFTRENPAEVVNY